MSESISTDASRSDAKAPDAHAQGSAASPEPASPEPASPKPMVPERFSQDFCPHCGSRLVLREQPEDGPRPWCPTCQTWRYPSFSTACSMIVVHPNGRHVLLIDQYGKRGILVAGYVSQGEDLERTVRREVSEEVGLSLSLVRFNASSFFAPSNTLMVNFVCQATSADVQPDHEVDAWRWVELDQLADSMLPGSLAQRFVRQALARLLEA